MFMDVIPFRPNSTSISNCSIFILNKHALGLASLLFLIALLLLSTPLLKELGILRNFETPLSISLVESSCCDQFERGRKISGI
jgi:hypothetical protein